jgi:hypothetical protein
VARALYGAFKNGLPETVLRGINFIGVHSSIQSNTKEQTAYAITPTQIENHFPLTLLFLTLLILMLKPKK